jgi:hypothetical protein
MFQSTTLGLELKPGRPKRVRKIQPMRVERYVNEEEWREEKSRFGKILRGPQGVLLPENVFREIEQDMNRLLTSENKIKFILQICQTFYPRLHVVS